MYDLPRTHLLVSEHGREVGLVFDEDIAEVVVCRKTERKVRGNGEIEVSRRVCVCVCVCARVCVLMMTGQKKESSGMKTETDGVAGQASDCS